MSARRIAIIAGFVGGIGWLAKMLVLAVQGGPDPDSAPETIAFLTGLVGVPCAAAAAAAHLTGKRSPLFRAGAAIAAVVALMLVSLLLQVALTALPGDSWVQAEVVFPLVGIAAVATAIVLRRADEGDRVTP